MLVLETFKLLCLAAVVKAAVNQCCTGLSCQTHNYMCPPGETKTVVNPENCQMYYTCLNGVTTLEKCPDGTMFDVKHLACTQDQEMNCVGRPIPEKTTCIYVCENSLGIYPNPEDTTSRSYYYCYYGVPTLMYCPSGTKYHNDKNGICANEPITLTTPFPTAS